MKTTKKTATKKANSLKNLKSWKPGQSGNPKGMKKGALHTKTILKMMLDADPERFLVFDEKNESDKRINALIKTMKKKGAKTMKDLMMYRQLERATVGADLRSTDWVNRQIGEDPGEKVKVDGQIVLSVNEEDLEL